MGNRIGPVTSHAGRYRYSVTDCPFWKEKLCLFLFTLKWGRASSPSPWSKRSKIPTTSDPGRIVSRCLTDCEQKNTHNLNKTNLSFLSSHEKHCRIFEEFTISLLNWFVVEETRVVEKVSKSGGKANQIPRLGMTKWKNRRWYRQQR